MKSSEQEITPIIGTAMGGGFYAGRIRVGSEVFAIIVAPKADGECASAWNDSYKSVNGAKSYNDGLANTAAMAKAGSKLAKWAQSLRIAKCDGWYIPSQDELEIIYRNLKPTTESNSQYGRSGLNASAVVPTYPYTDAEPAQTKAEAFQAGGVEAFEDAWYWSSTQHAATAGYAWGQDFYGGYQNYSAKSSKGRARAVRRLAI